MLNLILFLVFIFVVVFSFIIGFFIDYHFKKLGIENDSKARKIISVYKIGALAIFFLSSVSLILLFV